MIGTHAPAAEYTRGDVQARRDPRASFVLSVLLLILMASQAVLGLAFPGAYRDADWIRATWFANDLVTLLVAVPLLCVALVLARRGSVRGRLIWLGLLGYGVYNYAFYLLGAALNPYFLVYVLAVVVSGAALILALAHTDVAAVAACLRAAPVRVVGGYVVLIAGGLAAGWVGMWAAHVFAGRPTPIEPEAFRLIASLDLTLMVPALAVGGVLLWRRRAWGYVIAAIAGVQGSLYLLVLTTGAQVAVRRGLADAPGEVPMWGALAASTAFATALLLWRRRAPRTAAAGTIG